MVKRSAPNSAGLNIANQILQGPTCPPVVLIICPDQIRQDRYLATLIKRFIPAADNQEVANKRFGGRSFNSNDLLALKQFLCSLSLFSPHKLAIVKDLQELSASLTKELAAAASEVPEGSYLFLLATHLSKTDRLFKLCQANQAAVELPALSGPELNRWVEHELRNVGICSYQKEVLAAIIELGGSEPDRIASIVQHLSLYVDSQSLTLQDLYAVFIAAPSPNEFKLIEAVTAKRTTSAQAELIQLLNRGKSPFLFLGLLYRTFSNYLTIRVMQHRGLNIQQIRERLKLAPWLFDKHCAAACRYELQQLKDGLAAIVHADSKLKHRSLGNEFVLVELLERLTPAR